jgi:hypothetical protein
MYLQSVVIEFYMLNTMSSDSLQQYKARYSSLNTHFIFTGEPMNMTGYARWGNGEPSHGKAANCGRLSRTGQLFDSYCTNVLAFFCEQ